MEDGTRFYPARLMRDSCMLVDNDWTFASAMSGGVSRGEHARARLRHAAAIDPLLIPKREITRARSRASASASANARESVYLPYVKRGIPANYSPVAEGRKPRRHYFYDSPAKISSRVCHALLLDGRTGVHLCVT